MTPQATRETFLQDVLTTVDESPAITYWARAEHGRREGWFVERERETPRRFKLTTRLIAKGLRRLHDRDFKVDPALRGEILAAEVECDGGLIDAEAADVIVQAACFGELIYG